MTPICFNSNTTEVAVVEANLWHCCDAEPGRHKCELPIHPQFQTRIPLIWPSYD